jgi:hypothetical protein
MKREELGKGSKLTFWIRISAEESSSMVNPFQDFLPKLLHFFQNLPLIQGEEFSVFHDQFAVDDHVPHVGTGSGINQVGDDVVNRLKVGLVQLQEDHVGLLAYL